MSFIDNWIAGECWKSWKYWTTLGRKTFQALGAIWSAMRLADYFFSEQLWYEVVDEWSPWAMPISSLAYGIWKSWPASVVRRQIDGTDIHIAIRIGDIFSQEGALIVGTNTTFDTTMHDGVISPESIQGQFTSKYFETRISQLDKQLDDVLDSNQILEDLTPEKKGYGKRKVYPLGTVVPVNASNNRKAYFFAMAHLNAHRTAQVEPQAFLDALPHLWNGIRDRGGMEDLLCPLLGARHGRLKAKRVALIGEVVRSFIVANRDGKLADNMTIVVTPDDMKQGGVDLKEMENLLEWECSKARELRMFDGPSGRPMES